MSVSYSGIPCRGPDFSLDAPAKPGIYYHYTSLSTLWAVLDSETLRATQARFSNDSEELRMGLRLMQKLCGAFEDRMGGGRPLSGYIDRLLSGDEADIDCYIVCFCGKNNILSQWRGYCREDGVSIGFDFDEGLSYYLKDQPREEQTAREAVLDQVIYVDSDGKSSKDSELDLPGKIEARLKELAEQGDLQRQKMFIDTVVPLIKHEGFWEEDEYRLLIRNAQGIQRGAVPFPLDHLVRYVTTGEVQRPYLNISFGKNPPKPDLKAPWKRGRGGPECEVMAYGMSAEDVRQLRALLRVKNLRITQKAFDGPRKLVIGPMEEQGQKKLFEKLDRILKADQALRDVKLWCAGHLPIRTITVSPCANQDEVIQSIRHYCAHRKYWLRYVDVTGSDIPYRRPK